ncbi:MAG: OmpA family protein [Bacteroidetes bacterium]|nr:OmpA family protein [Bacteroidota bacterium]
MKAYFLVLLCIFSVLTGYSQTGELDRFDCTYSKEVIIPFNYSATQSVVKPQLNQVVFYSYRDQFTYWYKIVAKSNATLKFKVAALNDSDSYAVYSYQYDPADFCQKLYQQKIKPLAPPFYVGYGSEHLQPQERVITIQKDHVYYISVLNTSLNNCGHRFNLSYGTDTLKVKAFHSPCKKDIETIPVVQKELKPPVTKDSVIVPKPEVITPPQIVSTPKDSVKIVVPVQEPKKVSNTVQYIVKDKKKSVAINATIMLVEVDTKERVTLDNTGVGTWQTVLEKDKTYKVKCTAFGYTDLDMYTDISKGNTVELWMEPLKVGDNFIMKSIYFHPNTYALRRESADELQRLLQYLINNPSVTIEIQGHTNGDNRIYKNKAYENLGEEWNFKGSSKDLSFKRSEAIKTYLVNNGINADRLVPTGFGGHKPIIQNPETMEEGQRNIRVEVVILKN